MTLTPIANHGVTAATPSNIPLGAGVFYRNLAWVASTYTAAVENTDWTAGGAVPANTYYERTGTEGAYVYTLTDDTVFVTGTTYYIATAAHWVGNLIGATSGGNKLDIKGELVDLEIDGAQIKVKGLTVMAGGAATMEVNMAELTTDIINMSLIGEKVTAGAEVVTGYDLIKVKNTITEGDYLENFAFVGKTADGSKNIIVIFDYALCTSGLSIEAKAKEGSVMKLTMEAYGDIEGDLSRVPCRIYYPTVA